MKLLTKLKQLFDFTLCDKELMGYNCKHRKGECNKGGK